jgi:predicted DNA-binding protein YlxM (UPF0122 family)
VKSAYQIANEIGVSPQSIYKKIEQQLCNQLLNHYTTKGKVRLYNEYAESLIKGLYGIQPTIEPVVEPLYNQLNNEIDYLRGQLEVERSRNHELAMQLSQITQNNQLLLGLAKQTWWQRVFGRRK